MQQQTQYPELLTLKRDELFVEGVRLHIGLEVLRMKINKVIPKNSLDAYRWELKRKYNADEAYFASTER